MYVAGSREECEEICNLYLNDEEKSFNDSMKKKFLTIEHLKMFKKLVGEAKDKRTQENADIFLFACFTGLRISDLISLKWSDVNMDRNMISHKQYKNHAHKAKMLYIPLNDMSRDILEKYNGKHEEFVFELLPSGCDLNNAAAFIKLKSSRTITINNSIGTIGYKMGLPFKLHIHLGRHTFSMLALNRGVDIKTTSSMLGHASTMVTEKIYATLLPNTIAEAVGD